LTVHNTSGLPRDVGATDEWRGVGDLLALAVDRFTTPVEGMHRAIVDRSLRWAGRVGAPVRRVADALIANAYGTVRATGGAVGALIGLAAKATAEGGDVGVMSRSRRGSQALAAINATWGDELAQRESPLRIEMGLRDRSGEPIEVASAALADAFPSLAPRVVVLVHGLGQVERCWLGDGDGPGLWDMLGDDPSVTPVGVRYNSGRHVSENGVDLARLIDELWRCWPAPIEGISLVGHSMGGLVVRSACHVGRSEGQEWVAAVDKVVTLGAPHLGAPLEKAANLMSWGLRIAPQSRPLAGLLDGRSAGIKDLRFGSVVEDDWRGTEPNALFRNPVGDVPLLEGVDHHFVAAVVTSDPAHPLGFLLGDLMVRPASGTGRGRRRHIEATDARVLGGRRHFDLLNDSGVLDQVLSWVARG